MCSGDVAKELDLLIRYRLTCRDICHQYHHLSTGVDFQSDMRIDYRKYDRCYKLLKFLGIFTFCKREDIESCFFSICRKEVIDSKW